MCETEFVREDGKIKVFLLDDHEVVRRGVHELLSVEEDIEVVGEAGTAAEALVADPRHPARRGRARRAPAGRQRRRGVPRGPLAGCRTIKCLMLTSFADDEALFDAIMAGAAGYVLKQIRGTDLVDAVRTVGRRRVAARPGRDRPGAGAAARRQRRARHEPLAAPHRARSGTSST